MSKEIDSRPFFNGRLSPMVLLRAAFWFSLFFHVLPVSHSGKNHFTVIAVTWGWGPSYQYRKPSTSTVSPTLRFFTAS